MSTCVKTWRNQTEPDLFYSLLLALSANIQQGNEREAALFGIFYINADNFLINIEFSFILCKISMATFKPDVIAELNSTLMQINSILIKNSTINAHLKILMIPE